MELATHVIMNPAFSERITVKKQINFFILILSPLLSDKINER